MVYKMARAIQSIRTGEELEELRDKVHNLFRFSLDAAFYQFYNNCVGERFKEYPNIRT
jgi:hypothetical protein